MDQSLFVISQDATMAKNQNSPNIKNKQTDHNHPLYLQALDTPGVALIPMKLSRPENYGIWSRSMRIAY